MSTRLLGVCLLTAASLSSGCWWHHWHRHCCYPPAAQEPAPAPVQPSVPGQGR